jgi:hypothetical protein
MLAEPSRFLAKTNVSNEFGVVELLEPGVVVDADRLIKVVGRDLLTPINPERELGVGANDVVELSLVSRRPPLVKITDWAAGDSV